MSWLNCPDSDSKLYVVCIGMVGVGEGGAKVRMGERGVEAGVRRGGWKGGEGEG
jgi:hypothetical protein